MNDSEFPREVRGLIASALASMDHVEVLVLLHRNAPAFLTRDDVVKQTGIAPGLVDRAIADLETRGLITVNDTAGGPTLAYSPRSEELRDTVDKLVTLYNERPVSLIRAVYDRPAHPVISFADAFRVRGGNQ